MNSFPDNMTPPMVGGVPSTDEPRNGGVVSDLIAEIQEQPGVHVSPIVRMNTQGDVIADGAMEESLESFAKNQTNLKSIEKHDVSEGFVHLPPGGVPVWMGQVNVTPPQLHIEATIDNTPDAVREFADRLRASVDAANGPVDAVNQIRIDGKTVAGTDAGVDKLMGPVRRLAAIDAEIDELEEALKKKKKERDLCDVIACEVMAEAKITSIPLWHNGKPISAYVATEFKCHKKKGIGMGQAVAWLRKNELEWLIDATYSPARLKSHIVEVLAEDDPELPKGFAELFDIYDEKSVRIVRTSKQESTTARAARHLRAIKKKSDG